MVLDTPRVLASAAHTLTLAREKVPWYASAWAPARTDHVAELLTRSHVHLVVRPIEDNALGMVLPKCRGKHTMIVEKETPRTDRMFIIRHELAHVLRGDVGEEPLYFTNDDDWSFQERTADLFALADLMPGRILQDVRRARMAWRDILRDLTTDCLQLVSLDWSQERAYDRADLRLRLFRDFGI